MGLLKVTTVVTTGVDGTNSYQRTLTLIISHSAELCVSIKYFLYSWFTLTAGLCSTLSVLCLGGRGGRCTGAG